MTETIRKQILAVRDTALTNMFDVNMVQRIANDMGFTNWSSIWKTTAESMPTSF